MKDGYPANRAGNCDLMGLTWVLAKDRAAYMTVVTHILRTFIAAAGEPMAVDSAELGKEEPSAGTAAADVVIGLPFGSRRMLLVVVVLSSPSSSSSSKRKRKLVLAVGWVHLSFFFLFKFVLVG